MISHSPKSSYERRWTGGTSQLNHSWTGRDHFAELSGRHSQQMVLLLALIEIVSMWVASYQSVDLSERVGDLDYCVGSGGWSSFICRWRCEEQWPGGEKE